MVIEKSLIDYVIGQSQQIPIPIPIWHPTQVLAICNTKQEVTSGVILFNLFDPIE